ncbi:MAG: cyclic nucleotide-binding domain-containing protein [Planctomycetota bacterium]|nr:MAG: cyclic nucleotide-binding domain-containing protein [Planctomycetota bacterium]
MFTPDEILERVIPFQFLARAQRARLAKRLELRRYRAGEYLLRAGERSRDVFLLGEGEVDCVDDREPPIVLSTIVAGHYFGERAALFDAPREVSIRARGDVAAYTLPGKDFLELVDTEPVFAQALANTLKVKQGIFLPYQRLYGRLLSLLEQREFLLSALIPAYRTLCPALHPLLEDERIDTDALAYAVARLPEGVTRTTFYYLTTDLPPLYSEPDSKFEAVHTKARRRAAWECMPSKLLILLRDGVSDISDFLTCLCLYAVEARKIRHRLRDGEVLRELKRLCEEPDPQAAERLIARLDLSPAEREGLRRIWPNDLARRLRDILLHHEDVALECDMQIDNYNSRASEVWVSQIREEAARLCDLEDPELEVHIISSNTHSVANCLSAYLGEHAEEILAWGRAQRPELTGEPVDERPWGAGWRDPRDLVYALARHYFAENPAARAEYEASEAHARRHLSSTAFTGIEVDLIDARKLDPARADPRVRVRRPRRPLLVVNVDYAFGQQAEEILANLLFVFGRRVASVNVLGKAGGLVGARGDVLLPPATLLQTNDELYPVPNRDLSGDLLRSLIPDRRVHEGPVLTVAGTLLQDRTLLHFYRRIWSCVGLEMEGSYFARQLTSAIETGVVRPEVRSRFVYYVSDVPLDPEENLSEALAPWEGVPPLYAVTRAVLRRIFAEHDEAGGRGA